MSALGQKDISHCNRHVCFGSKADMCVAKSDVCFTPNSDRESGHRQTVRSALPPKADMCSAQAHVCFGPKADIQNRFALSASCRAKRASVIVPRGARLLMQRPEYC